MTQPVRKKFDICALQAEKTDRQTDRCRNSATSPIYRQRQSGHFEDSAAVAYLLALGLTAERMLSGRYPFHWKHEFCP